eukprot:768476-Hanusia_phi.AAC.5
MRDSQPDLNGHEDAEGDQELDSPHSSPQEQDKLMRALPKRLHCLVYLALHAFTSGRGRVGNHLRQGWGSPGAVGSRGWGGSHLRQKPHV